MAGSNLSNLERKALELIKKNPGILQSQLWRTLGLDSREGSRLVIRLVNKGLVHREQTTVDGRRTYKLFAVEGRVTTGKLVVNMDFALRIPCTTCPYFQECGSTSKYDPATCPILDRWLDYLLIRLRTAWAAKAKR